MHDRPTPTWDRTFNAALRHGYGEITVAARTAIDAAYPFLAWNERIYAVGMASHDAGAWPTWDDTGHVVADDGTIVSRALEDECPFLCGYYDECGDVEALDDLVRGLAARDWSDGGIEAKIRFLLGALGIAGARAELCRLTGVPADFLDARDKKGATACP